MHNHSGRETLGSKGKTMRLYVYPPSMFSQKVLMACYEKRLDFIQENVNLFDKEAYAKFAPLSPWGRVPLLIADDDTVVAESSIIIEYLDNEFASGTQLIPKDKKDALAIRYFDRIFDYFLTDPLAKLFHASHRPEDPQYNRIVLAAHEQLDDIYAWMDEHLTDRKWVGGAEFSLADCAAAPALNRSLTVHPFGRYMNVVEYWQRLSVRASWLRTCANASAYA